MTRVPPTRAELIAAIADANPANPLAAAIGAVITSYGVELDNHAKRAGSLPVPILLSAPHTEIEAFALELVVNELSAMGGRVQIRR